MLRAIFGFRTYCMLLWICLNRITDRSRPLTSQPLACLLTQLRDGFLNNLITDRQPASIQFTFCRTRQSDHFRVLPLICNDMPQ